MFSFELYFDLRSSRGTMTVSASIIMRARSSVGFRGVIWFRGVYINRRREGERKLVRVGEGWGGDVNCKGGAGGVAGGA